MSDTCVRNSLLSWVEWLPLTAPFPFHDLPLRAPLMLQPIFSYPLDALLSLTGFSARSAYAPFTFQATINHYYFGSYLFHCADFSGSSVCRLAVGLFLDSDIIKCINPTNSTAFLTLETCILRTVEWQFFLNLALGSSWRQVHEADVDGC